MKSLALLNVFCLSAALAPTIARADVKVDRQPTVVERRTFDPAHRPPEMPPLRGNEAAVTESNFDCQVSMDYRVLGHQRRPDGCNATLQVRGVHVELHLKVILWLPEHAPAKLIAHEEGHRQIAERVYAEAEQTARAIAKSMDGKQVNGDGLDCAAAEKQASDATAKGFCKEYLRQTATVAGRVNDEYDDLTAHGTRAEPAEAEAIREAFQKAGGKAGK